MKKEQAKPSTKQLSEKEAVDGDKPQTPLGDGLGSYDAEHITILRGLDGVRKRPAMYIGDTAQRGLHHLLEEVIDNAIDETLAGFCTRIDVILHKDGSATVMDDGRGIPVDEHPQEKKSGVEVAMTMLHAGSKFGDGSYKVSGGLHGVGISVVNALSEWLSVEVHRDGKIWRQKYSRGEPKGNLSPGEKTHLTGTKISFKPDPNIFETLELDFTIISARLLELAFLNHQVRIVLKDECSDKEETFHEEGGLKSFVEHLNANKETLHEPIHLKGNREDTEVEVVLQYNNGYKDAIVSFANDVKTVDGGTHESGFKTALTRTVNQYARKQNIIKEREANLVGDDVREGLMAIIAVKLIHPQFEGQTKHKLGNSEMERAVSSIVYDQLTTFLDENPKVGRNLARKAVDASRAREAAKRAAELVRRKSALEDMSLPGKLADCTEKDPKHCEIFLVEGDSAGGTARQARDRRTQAILPLRGKVLNVWKHRSGKVLGNEEIRAMITAIGTGIVNPEGAKSDGNGNGAQEQSNGFDLEKRRYDRIILMTDADIDGSHIRTLLLTFLFRYMPDLIRENKVYIAQPPLFSVRKGRKVDYAHTEKERDILLKELGRGATAQRYKGLGEMNDDELATTTMDKENRSLIQVTMEGDDAYNKANDLFTKLMGDNVELRKKCIEENAELVAKDLDI